MPDLCQKYINKELMTKMARWMGNQIGNSVNLYQHLWLQHDAYLQKDCGETASLLYNRKYWVSAREIEKHHRKRSKGIR